MDKVIRWILWIRYITKSYGCNVMVYYGVMTNMIIDKNRFSQSHISIEQIPLPSRFSFHLLLRSFLPTSSPAQCHKIHVLTSNMSSNIYGFVASRHGAWVYNDRTGTFHQIPYSTFTPTSPQFSPIPIPNFPYGQIFPLPHSNSPNFPFDSRFGSRLIPSHFLPILFPIKIPNFPLYPLYHPSQTITNPTFLPKIVTYAINRIFPT